MYMELHSYTCDSLIIVKLKLLYQDGLNGVVLCKLIMYGVSSQKQPPI